MLAKIKEFLFGKDPVQSPVATPYKVETPAPKVEVVPVGTEASMAAPVAAKPKVEPKPKAPAKPKAVPTARAPAKPKAEPKPKAPNPPAK
jgi:hypothetical protein